METANVAAQGVCSRIEELHQVLINLGETFEPLLEGLQSLVTHSPKNWSGKIDYTKLSKEDQIGIMTSMMMAKTIKNVLETPILDEQGLITVASDARRGEAHSNLVDVEER
jgi:hypothetical protein